MSENRARTPFLPADEIPIVLVLLALLLGGCAASGGERPAAPPAAPPPAAAGSWGEGSIYASSARLALFEDRKARAVGDTLTVVLVEQTSAQKSATTSTTKSDSVDIGAPTIFGQGVTHNGRAILSASLDAEREFAGAGDSTASNKLTGSVTVRVIALRPNGNLVIEGEKRLTLNQGEENVKISGEVHPADIAADNTVLSSRVADARIEYAGTGALADANRQGWLSRLFNSVLWPF